MARAGSDSVHHILRALIFVLCSAFILQVSFISVDPGGASRGQSEETAGRPRPSDGGLEALTLGRLEEIQAGLNAGEREERSRKPWEDGKWQKDLRNRLINISMWWKFADVTSWVLRMAGDHAWVRAACFFAMPFLEWMCEPFVLAVDADLPPEKLGKTMDSIARFIDSRKKAGISVSLDNVGDASLSREAAARYSDFYLQLMRSLSGRKDIDEIAFSVKFSALVYQLERIRGLTDPDSTPSEEARGKAGEIKKALVRLLRAADQVNGKRVFIRIDMEEYEYKDATLALFKEVVEENPLIVKNADGSLRLGVVIQAFLRESYKDLDDLREWGAKNNVRVPVSLVKSACEKSEKELAKKPGEGKSPVWNFKPSTDASYEKLSEFLILNESRFEPAFATHNIRTIAHVMALADLYGVGKDRLQFQMLYGVGDEVTAALAGMGYSVRTHVPAGACSRGMKYAGRRFHELANKENALSGTLRGDYAHLDGSPPEFQGAQDVEDGRRVDALAASALTARPSVGL